MSRHRLLGQAVRFASVGALSTVAYLGLYAVLRTWISASWANLVALVAATIVNTAVNRRFTFGIRGREAVVRHQVQALLVFGVALGLSEGALELLHVPGGSPPRVVELGALVVANVLATAFRFVLLRLWVFRPTAGPRASRIPTRAREPGAGEPQRVPADIGDPMEGVHSARATRL